MARCYTYYDNSYYCNSAWQEWGRWVLFAAIVIGFILFFFLFSCLSARRRRRRGLRPFYGTGWVGHNNQQNYNPNFQNQQQPPQGQWGYNNNNNNHQQPQQQYGSPPGQPGGYYNNNQGDYDANQHNGANQSYYSPQQTGATELQSPMNTYRPGGEQVYSPPVGPPPGK